MPSWDPADLETRIEAKVVAQTGAPMITLVEAMWLGICQAIADWGVANGGFGGGGGGGGVASVTAGSTKISIGGTLTNPTVDVVPANLTGIPEAGITGLVADLAARVLTSSLAAIATSGSAADLVAGTVPAARMPAHTGDVTSAIGTVALAIGVNKVLDTMLRQGAATSLVGRAAGSIGNVADIVATGNGQFPLTAGGALAFADFPTQVALSMPGLGLFGDGSDGALHFDGATTILGVVPAANRYLVPFDVFSSSLTVDAGVVVIMQSQDTETSNNQGIQARRMFCTGTATINGKIANNGNSSATTGTTARGNAAANYTSTSPGTAGSGGAGVGGAATNLSSHIVKTQSSSAGGAANTQGVDSVGNYLGGGGGGGGTSAGGTGGGTTVLATASNLGLKHLRPLMTGVIENTNAAFFLCGTGGGGGGGAGIAGGGGGGGGGGVVCVAARFLAGSGSIEAKGGTGSGGGAANSGGGGGGGGGTAVVLTTSTTGLPTISVAGGAGGVGNGTGGRGGNGSAGKIYLFNV